MQNRALLITIGVAVLFIIIGIWLYLFLFGTPDTGDEIFTNLGVFPESGEAPEVIDETTQPNLVDVAGEPLRQLTTTPVAGYTITEDEVHFVEAGTGYIFTINLDTGTQTQRTNTTVAGTVQATFSPNHSRVAMTRFEGYTPLVTVGTVAGNTLDTIELEPGATNLSWDGNTRLRYTISRDGETVGYEQDLQEKTREEVFVFDLVQAHVNWEGVRPIVWSAPALNFISTAYEIAGATLTPLPVRRSALQVMRFNGDTLVYTMRQGDSLESMADNTTMAQSLLREKCVDRLVETDLYCGGPIVRFGAETYFEWLKGLHISDDQVWRTDLSTGIATLIIDPERESSRPLDITRPQLSPQDDGFFFIHKTDQTLWMVDLNEV
jgi:hypothetical protein